MPRRAWTRGNARHVLEVQRGRKTAPQLNKQQEGIQREVFYSQLKEVI